MAANDDRRVSDRFSLRIADHPRIFAYAHSLDGPLVLVVRDQLLVCRSARDTVRSALADLHIDSTPLTTLLEGIPRSLLPARLEPDGEGDVDILKVWIPPGLDVVRLTRRLRERGDLGDRDVSPNHVLVPAAWSHGCPSEPPDEAPAGELPERSAPLQPVTVIDSGCQWNEAWGANPLDALVVGGPFAWREAEFLGQTEWEAGTPDEPDVDGDQLLDALAGHANFIAGVIAQNCEHAQITIWNHNGGFHPDSDDFPTEAAVCRSLIRSQCETPSKVIDVGFAFKALDDAISCLWDRTFEVIGDDVAVVAPAGNQGIDEPYYPAALPSRYPGRFRNVVGVGSIDPAREGGVSARSGFSNHGAWVRCSAVGGQVVSTFLGGQWQVEDDPENPPRRRDFQSRWASWSGTSFAAPKVVAAIACRLADPEAALATTAVAAWNEIDDALANGSVGEGAGRIVR
jgi:hypothetical protein